LQRLTASLQQAEHLQGLSIEILGLLNEDLTLSETISRAITAIKRCTGLGAVGLRLCSGEDFPYFSQDGFTEGFLSTENTLVARNPQGDVCRDQAGKACLECTCGLVISGQTDPTNPIFTPKGSLFINRGQDSPGFPSPHNDPRLNARNRCLHDGYHSVALVPVCAHQEIIGLLQLNDPREDRFTLEMIQFFEGLSASIGLFLMRKQAEEALVTSGAKLELALTSSNMGVWSWEVASDRRIFDATTCHLLGLDPTTFAGTADEFFAAMHPGDRELVKAALRKTTESNAPYETEYRAIWPDGSVHHILARGRCVRNAQGLPKSITGVIWDVTERKNEQVALRKNEALQQAIISNISDVIAIVDRDGISRYRSSNIEKWFGWQSGELLGTSAFDNVHPDDRQSTREMFGALLTEPGATRTGECRYRCKDGTYKWIEFRAANLFHVSDIAGVLLNFRDVTERKRVEERLKLLSATVDIATDGAYFMTEDGRFIFANSAGCQMLKYSREELLSLRVFDVNPSMTQQRWRVLWQELRTTKKNSFESEHRRKDGSLFPVEISPIFVNFDGNEYLNGFVRDITGRKQIEAALRDRENELVQAQRISHVGNWRRDLSTQQVTWSAEMFRIWGLDPARGLPSSRAEYVKLVHPDDVQRFGAAQRDAIELGKPYEVEFRVCRPDGRESTIVSICNPELDASGKVTGLRGVVQDITERKQAEKALQAQYAEMERFTYAVSHDLKSPLVTIKTFLEFLDKDLSDHDADGVAKDLGFISNATEKMSQLLDELLKLSRVGRVTNPSVEVPLQTVVGEALGLVAGRLTARGVEVSVTDRPVILIGDRRRLVELFQNLLDNAAKFMGDQPTPRVVIGVKQTSEGLLLFVRDNGIGFLPQQKDKLFGLFQKLDSGAEGTGIGLALVKRIVQIHGGMIWAESEGLGLGATFKFTLAQTRLGGDSETLS
jgi:PAS domain S-box-containing protein